MEKSAQKKPKKTKIIKEDQGKIYLQAFDLVHQALHTCIIRDVVKEYRYQREEAMKKYNSVIIVSHVALENHSIQQLWKLFDKKNSVFNLWHVIESMPHKTLNTWLIDKIDYIKEDLENLEAWRHNIVSHRSGMGYFKPKEFEKRFPDRAKHEENIKNFLFDFLSKIKLEMQGISVKETKAKLIKGLKSHERFAIEELKQVFKTYDNS